MGEKGLLEFLSDDKTNNIVKLISIATIAYLLINDFIIFTSVFNFEQGEFVDFIVYNLSFANLPYMASIALLSPFIMIFFYISSYVSMDFAYKLLHSEQHSDNKIHAIFNSLKQRVIALLNNKKAQFSYSLIVICLAACFILLIEIIGLSLIEKFQNNPVLYFLLLLYLTLLLTTFIVVYVHKKTKQEKLELSLVGIIIVESILSLLYCLYNPAYSIAFIILFMQNIIVIFVTFQREIKLDKNYGIFKQFISIAVMLIAFILPLIQKDDWRHLENKNSTISLLLNKKLLINNSEKIEIQLENHQLDNIIKKLCERQVANNTGRKIENYKLIFDNNASVKALPVSEKVKLYFIETNGTKIEGNKTIPARYAEVYVVKQRDLENNCTKCTELLGMNMYELSDYKK